ncbi:MAG TPA: hypothetical protein VF020_16250, partial [Chthoniobacterales bacterium]
MSPIGLIRSLVLRTAECSQITTGAQDGTASHGHPPPFTVNRERRNRTADCQPPTATTMNLAAFPKRPLGLAEGTGTARKIIILLLSG